jgi:hypothetical protein
MHGYNFTKVLIPRIIARQIILESGILEASFQGPSSVIY